MNLFHNEDEADADVDVEKIKSEVTTTKDVSN